MKNKLIVSALKNMFTSWFFSGIHMGLVLILMMLSLSAVTYWADSKTIWLVVVTTVFWELSLFVVSLFIVKNQLEIYV